MKKFFDVRFEAVKFLGASINTMNFKVQGVFASPRISGEFNFTKVNGIYVTKDLFCLDKNVSLTKYEELVNDVQAAISREMNKFHKKLLSEEILSFDDVEQYSVDSTSYFTSNMNVFNHTVIVDAFKTGDAPWDIHQTNSMICFEGDFIDVDFSDYISKWLELSQQVKHLMHI